MELGSIITTASLILNALALLMILIGFLLGLRRGLLHSTIRLVAVICAIGCAIITARILQNTASDLLETYLPELLAEVGMADTVGELIDASPTVHEMILKMPGALVAPLLFLVSFFVLNIIFYIIYKIFKRVTRNTKARLADTPLAKAHLGKLSGSLVSLVASALIVACFLSPFAGYLFFADEIVNELESVSIEEDLDATVREIDSEYLDPVCANEALSISGKLLKPIVFDTVSTCEINGYKVVWSEEVTYLAELYGTIQPLIESEFDLSTFGQAEADALRDFAEKFDDSALVPHIIADILPAMAGEWNEGEDFCGISNPAATVSPQLQPMMNTVVNVLETTTYESLPQDITTLTELLAVLSESGTLATFGGDISTQDIITALSKSGLISGIIDNLFLNTHMRALVSDIANLGFDAISESLSIPTDDEAIREELNGKLNEAIAKTESIEDYDKKISSLTADIGNIFDKYGVEADKETVKLYAECIVGTGPITTENGNADVSEYFAMIDQAIESELSNLEAIGAPVFASTPVNEKVKEAVKAYLATKDDSAAQNARSLCNQIRGEEALKHAVITLSDIHLSAEEMSAMSFEDMHKQSQSLEDIIRVLSTVMVFDENGALSIDLTKIDANALSDALFRLASTGKDENGNVIHNIAHAITGVVKFALFQVGINANAANDLVNHMTTVRADGSTKNPLTSALAVLNVVQTDKEMTAEDVKESVTTLVKDLDKETAKVLADCISTNLINSFIPSDMQTEQTDALVTVTKDIIEGFGEYAEDLTDEQLEAESAYMETIFDLAMSAGSGNADSFFATEDGESSTVDMTVDEFVETISQSVIISNTVKEETDNLKSVIGDSLPEAEKEALVDVIEQNEALDEELKNALLNIFGKTALPSNIIG